MKQTSKIVCIIPARLESKRFPRKLISPLHGKTVLEWVWLAAKRVTLFDDVMFAIDAPETAAVIDRFGGKYVYTSTNCQSGTDRLVELACNGKVSADIWVNWQGDEPFIVQEMIETLLQSTDPQSGEMWTLKKLIQDPHQIHSPKVAKVVCDGNGYALYFSRAPIPFFRDEQDPHVLVAKKVYYKHVGLYAYTTDALKKIASMGPSTLEKAEMLEQLRFLEHNLRIKVHETTHEVFGIDFPEDLVKAEERIRSGSASVLL
jgi:3-deoxy-manno-octulosonate cytidylyltransferase (CMP-KDO synthetase)